MSRFNKLFSGDPPGEPAWMREFFGGGDPSVHREEAAWPVAGLAAHHAQASKKKCPRAKAHASVAGRNPTHKSRAAAVGSSIARKSRPTGRKERGECSRGGSGNCKSEGGGGDEGCACGGGGCKSGAGAALSNESQGTRSLVSPSHSSAHSRRSSRRPSVAGIVALVQRELAIDGIEATESEVTGIVTEALPSGWDLGATFRPATGQSVQPEPNTTKSRGRP